MAKLGEQVAVVERRPPTRTQRLIQRKEQAERREILRQKVSQAQQKLSTAKNLSEYEEQYKALDPEMQQYFSAPSEIKQKQQEQIQKNLTKADSRVEYYNQRIQRIRENKAKYEEWYGRQSNEYRSNPKNEKRRNEKLREYEVQENEAQEYINFWESGKGRYLEKGYSYGDVNSWVISNVDYKTAKTEARARARERKKAIEQKLAQAKPEDIQVVTQFKDGKVIERKILVREEGKDFELIGVQKPTMLPAGAKPSDIGQVELEESVRVGDRRVTFPTTTQVYEKGEKYYSPFTEIKVTEPDLEAEYKKAIKPDKIYVDVTKVTEPDISFATKTTVTDRPRTKFIPIVPPTVDDGTKDKGIIATAVGLYEKIPSPSLYYTPPKPVSLGVPSPISPFKITEDSIKVGELKEQAGAFLDVKAQETLEKEITRTGVKAEADIKFQEEYEAKFYRSDIGKKAFFGEIDFEEAKKQFEESDEAKIIQKKYEAEISEARAGKFTKEGFQLAGINLARQGLFFVPTTVKGAVVGGALAYTGVKVISATPTAVLNLATAGIGTVGVYQAVSPTASPEEKASGVFTAGISASFLGYQGVKWLRQPTIKTVKIKVPRPTVEASATIGKDIKEITSKGTVERVIYGKQKLSQIAVAGRRTVISTRFRDLLKLDPVYRGVPYAQRGTTYAVEGFRGVYTYITPSGYKKAFDLLTKRAGFTSYQAKQTLRYIQPKFIEQYLLEGSITVKGATAKGSFTYLTKQPQLVIDEALGIKTRGATPIRDIFEVRRQAITLKRTGEIAVLEAKGRLRFLMKPTELTIKDFEFSRGIIFTKTSDLKRGYEFLGRDPYGISVFKEADYRVLGTGSFEQKLIPFSKVNIDKMLTDSKYWNLRKTILYPKQVDLTKVQAIKKAPITKTPFSKTFAPSSQDLQTVEKVKQAVARTGDATKTKAVSQLIEKVEEGRKVAQSQYYGTGLYEKTTGGLLPQDLISVEALKVPVTPVPVQVTPPSLSVIPVIAEQSKLVASTGLASSLLSQQLLKQEINLRLDAGLKDIARTDVKEALETRVGTAQKVALKPVSVLEGALETPVGTETPQIPPTTPPTIRTPPSIPIFPLLAGTRRKKKKKKKDLVEALYEKAYLPDFTTKIAGLDAVDVDIKQAKRLINKLQTGLEIRRGVKIKR